MAIESITKALGSGSGIDVGALVTSLVEAQVAAKSQGIKDRGDALAARISGVGKLRSAITGFDTALKSLVRSGSLATQPTSSNEAVLKVGRLPGATGEIPATTLAVERLAAAQASTTNMPVARTQAFGTGTLSLQFGADTVDEQGSVTGFAAAGDPIAIDITAADATLDGIAAKINLAGAGVTAAVVNDGTGARLTVKGPTGAARAFTLTSGGSDTSNGGLDLSTLNVGAGSATTTTGTRARDAVVLLDGARFTRSTNSVTDLVQGLKLDLVGASATPVTIGATRPGAALSQAVNDFTQTYNELLAVLKEETDPRTGSLRSDPAAQLLARGLRSLTTATLIPAGRTGAPRTLADLGVATARDGTLSANAARLDAALNGFPEAMEAIFADRAASGLSAALSAITLRVTDRTFGLDASTTRYTKQQAALADEETAVKTQTERLRARLTQQFAAMDSKVAAYKSTQTFLDNQIKAWNSSNA